MGGMFTTTLRTAAPLLLAQLAFAANTLVTQFFLARHSTTALHASLPGSMLAVAYMAFFNATLGYAGTIFARRDGAGDGRGAMAAFVQSVWLTLFTMPLLALGMPVARLVLGAFNTSSEVLAAETLYFDILMLNAADSSRDRGRRRSSAPSPYLALQSTWRSPLCSYLASRDFLAESRAQASPRHWRTSYRA